MDFLFCSIYLAVCPYAPVVVGHRNISGFKQDDESNVLIISTMPGI